MVHSRNKGKVGELEVAAMLREHGFDARRGQQFSGSPDSPDVVTDLEGHHVEVKRTERLDLYAAVDQAAADAPEGAMPVVFHRRSRKPWVVIMPAEEYLRREAERRW